MNSDNRIVQQAKGINMASHQNTVATVEVIALSVIIWLAGKWRMQKV